MMPSSPVKAVVSLLLTLISLCHPVTATSQWAASFTTIPPASGSAWFDFDFATADTGFLVLNKYFSVSTGYTYQILKTTNGGVSWSEMDAREKTNKSPNGAFVFDIDVVHEDTLFFTTRDYFNFLYRRTTQGGTTGYRMMMDIPWDMSAVNGTSAYVLTQGLAGGYMALFHFNGDSLYKVYENINLVTDHTSKVFFITPQTGFILVKDLTQENVLLKTSDGGATFDPVVFPSGMIIHALFFADEQTGYIAGSNGQVYRTNDQGVSWQLLNTGTTATLNNIHFNGVMTGMVCGGSGTVIITTDGGQTWFPEPCAGNLTRGWIASSDKAYVCNDNFFPVFYKGIFPVSVSSGADRPVRMYPVPVEDELHLDFPLCRPSATLFEITSITCKPSLKGVLAADGVIHTGQLPSGLYVLQISMPEGRIIRKFVKK